MAFGSKARDSATPYVVYEFAVRGRVYYVGLGQRYSKRATDRWNHITKQMERLKREGMLPTNKMRALLTPSGAVIRTMIELGMGPHDICYPWKGVGRLNAEKAEAKVIARRLAQGCVLANVAGNSQLASVGDVLRYLGVRVTR